MNPPALVELSNYPLRNKGNFSAEASFRGNWISMHPSERQEVSEEIFNSVHYSRQNSNLQLLNSLSQLTIPACFTAAALETARWKGFFLFLVLIFTLFMMVHLSGQNIMIDNLYYLFFYYRNVMDWVQVRKDDLGEIFFRFKLTLKLTIWLEIALSEPNMFRLEIIYANMIINWIQSVLRI